MSELAHQSIQERMGKWKLHFEQIEDASSLSPLEKTRILEGQEKLRGVFDDDWLWVTAGVGFVHPLLGEIANLESGTQLDLARLGWNLETLKNVAGFRGLTGRLRSAREYLGAEAEVEIAAALFSGGFADIELSQGILIERKTKAPDIKARLGAEQVYFEVTTLRDSEDSIKASRTFYELTWPPDWEVIMYCQIHKILAAPRVREFKAQIQSAIAEVKQTRKYRYVGEPAVLDCLMVHTDLKEEGKDLARRFNMTTELRGAPVPTADSKQLKRAIRLKVSQLPLDQPGVVIILANLWFGEPANESYRRVVYEIEDEVYDWPNLVACVVINDLRVLGAQEIHEQRPHYVLVRKSTDGSVGKTALVIKNRYSSFKELQIVERAIDILSGGVTPAQ